MERKKIIYFLGIIAVIISAIVIFISYYSNNLMSIKSDQGKVVITSIITYTDDYLLYVPNNIISICDKKTGTISPLCDKPDCSHKRLSSSNPNPTCNAAAEDGLPTLPFIYDNKLYFFTTGTKKYGFGTYVLHQADMNGANRKELGHYEDIDLSTAYHVQDGYLFMAYQTLYDENNVNLLLEQPIASIIMIELATGEGTILTSKIGNNYYIDSVGGQDRIINYALSFSDTEELDNLTPEDWELINEHAYIEIYSFDIDTAVEKVIYYANKLNSASCMDVGAYVSLNDGEATHSYYISSISGVEQEILPGHTISILDDAEQLLCLEFTENFGNIYYTFDKYTGETKEISRFDLNQRISYMAVTEETVYVLAEKDSEFYFGYIDKNKLYQGESEKIHYLISASWD